MARLFFILDFQMTEPELVAEELFGREAVKRLTSSDFLLDTNTPIQLKWEDCMLVLFYGDNIESKNLVQIWALAANQVVGPIFAAINIKTEEQVAQSFVKIRQQSTPYRLFGLKGYPFIIAYQGGYPVAFFNGARDVQAIVDWALTLACKPDYYEPVQLAASVHVDRSFEMGGVNEYVPRVDSLAFVAGSPVRRYDPRTGIKETGSRAAAAAAQAETAERAAAGVAVTAPPETGETAAGVIPGATTAATELGTGLIPAAVAAATRLGTGVIPAAVAAARVSQ